MKYAHVDENGQLLGWYVREIHGNNIPTPNIEVSDEQWQHALMEHHNKVNADGTTERFEFRSKDEIDEENIAHANAGFRRYLNATDYQITRHREQLELGLETTLSETEYRALLNSRQSARSKVV